MLRISGATLKEKALIRKVEKACFKAVGQDNFFVVDITVTDADTIKRLNASARGVDKVTDVLSFPCFDRLGVPVGQDKFNDCDYEGKRVMLGSVMICIDLASEHDKEFNP